MELMRTIDWRDGRVVAIDQTLLPATLRMIDIRTVAELVDAIRRLAVRGAPALGVAGALGVALAARGHDADEVRRQAAELRAARPTAVNLSWGVDRALTCLDDGADAVLEEALVILEEDVEYNRRLARRGADWLLDRA